MCIMTHAVIHYTPSSHSKNSLSKICSKGWVAQKSFLIGSLTAALRFSKGWVRKDTNLGCIHIHHYYYYHHHLLLSLLLLSLLLLLFYEDWKDTNLGLRTGCTGDLATGQRRGRGPGRHIYIYIYIYENIHISACFTLTAWAVRCLTLHIPGLEDSRSVLVRNVFILFYKR